MYHSINAQLAISSKQREQLGILPEVLPTGKISLHCYPSGISWGGALVLLLFTLRWCLHTTQNYLQSIILFLCQLSKGTSPWGRLGERRKYSRAWACGPLLRVPSGHAQARSHTYHFHLLMEYRCACPTLWYGGSESTQFMMGSSGHMVT